MEIGNKDLDKLDPDWRFAYFHAKSTRPGTCTEQNPELCECCLNIIHKEPIDLGVHAKELEFLGFGFPLWYSFLKYCIVLTLILIVSQSCVSVYRAIEMNKEFCSKEYNQYMIHSHPTIKTNQQHLQGYMHLKRSFSHFEEHPTSPHVQASEVSTIQSSHSEPSGHAEEGGHGQSGAHGQQGGHGVEGGHGEEGGHGQGHGKPHCTGVFILLSRIDTSIDDLEVMMRISTFVIIMFTLLFIRDTIYKTEQYYDERRCSIGDYSVMLSKLPTHFQLQNNKHEGIQQRVRRFFSQAFDTPYKIEEMILVPELDELQEAQQQKDHHIKHLQKLWKDGKQENEHEIKEIQHEIEHIQKKEQEAVEDFRTKLKNDTLESQKVIVILSTQPQKQQVLEAFQELDEDELVKYFGQQGVNVTIEEAPQPRQIIWEHINYPGAKRFGRILMGWGLSILFIAFITLIFYFVLKWKTHIVEQQQSPVGATVIVFIAIFSVILFNKFVMGTVLHHFTHIEMHATADTEQFSFAFKYALGMFFTTALMTLFVEAITYNNFYKHPYGVIEQQSIMFFMNSLLVPFIWTINPFQIMVLIKRKLNFGKKYLTQREANHLMQDFVYDVGKRYAEVLETMWFTFLYASLIPMGGFLTVIGIGLYYWVDKYNLLRRSSIKENISGKLSIKALTLLDLVLIFMPLGQIIFDHFLRNQIQISSIVMLVIGIIYICLPLNDIIDFFNKENFFLEEKPYRQVKDTFKDNYYTMHPMYSKTHADENSQSRRLYQDSVLRQFGNPVFSFALGWLAKAKGSKVKELAKPQSNMRSTRDESLIQNPSEQIKHMHHIMPNQQVA